VSVSGSARTCTSSRPCGSSARASLGQSTFVRTWKLRQLPPGRLRNPPDSEPPAGLDWDMWLGPARRCRSTRTASAWRPTAGHLSPLLRLRERHAGRLGGPLVDIVQWAMEAPGRRSSPARARSTRSRNNVETPDTWWPPSSTPTSCAPTEPPRQRQLDVREGLTASSSTAPRARCSSTARASSVPETRRVARCTDTGERTEKEVARTASMKMDEVDDGSSTTSATCSSA